MVTSPTHDIKSFLSICQFGSISSGRESFPDQMEEKKSSNRRHRGPLSPAIPTFPPNETHKTLAALFLQNNGGLAVGGEKELV